MIQFMIHLIYYKKILIVVLMILNLIFQILVKNFNLLIILYIQ